MNRMIAIAVCLALTGAACTDTYDYDPATAGDPEGSARPLRGKTASQFVRGIYADLVGRAPEAYEFVIRFAGAELRIPLDEERMLVDTLDGIGDSLPMRNLVANGLLHSTEVTVPEKSAVEPQAFIRDQFTTLLGREPNPYELAAFVTEWQADPAVGPRTVIRAIVGSREYQSQ
ncbi:MAG TPA: hypothetical protein VFQ53_08345 [Kofleriaceae bacterium]|nr:hypothetical protein [Kofleriaceae bacterium]